MMGGVDPTLRMHLFQGGVTKDPEQYLFIFETIWVVNNFNDDDVNIL
jgi:hypothetical protein